MIINERDLRHQSVVEAAHRTCRGARGFGEAGGGNAPTQRGDWLQIPASRRRQYSSGRGSDTHRHAPSHAGP